MAGLLRILTAAMLMVHFTVGCCVHHAHGCDADHGPPAECGGTPDGGDGHDGQGRDGLPGCQGGKCSVAPAVRSLSAFTAVPVQAALGWLPDAHASPPSAPGAPRLLAGGLLLLPVRLHLACQVLLI
jgi:hypothetical protein